MAKRRNLKWDEINRIVVGKPYNVKFEKVFVEVEDGEYDWSWAFVSFGAEKESIFSKNKSGVVSNDLVFNFVNSVKAEGVPVVFNGK